MITVDLNEIKNGSEKVKKEYDDFIESIMIFYPDIRDEIIYIDPEERCPICNSRIQYQEITPTNPGAMTWCTNDNCDYRYNQFMNYEDFKNN